MISRGIYAEVNEVSNRAALETKFLSERAKKARRISGVHDWLEFSTNPQTEFDIKDRILDNIDSVCVTYICRYSKLNSEFIEELMVLSTGLFNHRSYTEKNQKLVKEILDISYKNLSPTGTFVKTDKYVNQEVLDQINELESQLDYIVIPKTTVIRDRIDWYYILKYQKDNIDPWFIEKYKDRIMDAANENRGEIKNYMDDYID